MKRSVENLNIALVHEWITNFAGAEKVLFAMHELFPNAPIYTAVFDKDKAKAFADLDIRTSFLQKIPLMKKKRELMIPFTPFAFEQFDLSKYDLVISSTTMAAKGVITKPDTIHISYCHTPPRYLWEPQVDPRASKGRLNWLRTKTTHQMRIWDRLAAHRVDHFLSNSAYTGRRIKKYYQRDATVLYPPIDISQFSYDKDIKIEDYFLFVSRLVDYKRCDIVIQAFNKLGLPLIVIGYGPDTEKLQQQAEDNVKFVGGKFGDELRDFYQRAKAFVFAAEEDFGIVPVEAMACGRPVIAYGRGGVTESVVEGKTGLFFKEQTAESLVDAIKGFKPTDFDSAIIRKRAEEFSKEKFQKDLLDFIDKVI